jgi:uncharacterized protein (TIGR02145 family)
MAKQATHFPFGPSNVFGRDIPLKSKDNRSFFTTIFAANKPFNMKKIFTLALIISLQMIVGSVLGQNAAANEPEITIGKQTWKSKNLQVATFADETPIKLAQTAEEWATAARSKAPAYCYYSVLPEIEKLEKRKNEILNNASNIKSEPFVYEKQAELTELEEKFKAEIEKASKKKNSKKELAAIDVRYKAEVLPLLTSKKEHEKAVAADIEAQYTKATEGVSEIEEEIASLRNLEAELGKGAKYGYLYNYWAVIDPRGLAPTGYKIPSIEDWADLKKFIGPEPAVALKSTIGWFEIKNKKEYTGCGTDLYKFNGLPGGWRNNSNGAFMNLNDFTYWWTADKVASTNSAYARGLDCTKKDIWEDSNPFSGGLSIRCLKMSPKEIEKQKARKSN